jgi:YYY domain-containing protein
MVIVLVWWLWMQVIGLAAWPLAYRFFRRLPDKGYSFARPLGLLLTGYVLWIGASLGLLRNSVGGALFSLLLVAMASLAVYLRGRPQIAPPAAGGDSAAEGPSEARWPGRDSDPGLLSWLRSNGRLVLAVELLFAGTFALWALIRAYSPELATAGGEKFMEIMYLNSIARSEYFPPHDAWLSGFAISYYYFGYILIAMLTRLSGFAPHMTFHVGLALLFALTCTGAFGLVYNLVRSVAPHAKPETAAGGSAEVEAAGHQPSRDSGISWGLLGALLVAVLGNLQGFLEVLYSARLLPQGFWRWLDILDINQPFDPALGPSLTPVRSGWWWWRASRVIHDLDPSGQSMGIQPIDEFPGFSFLLGDMHPHVLALPFVLLALAVAFHALREDAATEGQPLPPSSGLAAWLSPLRQLSPGVPLCLGALAFLNTWDFPIYWGVFLVAYGLARWDRYGAFHWPLVRDVGLTGLAVAVLGFLFYFPFYIGFQSQAGGFLPTLYVGTRFRQYFVMFGPFLVAIAGFLAVLALRLRQDSPGARLLRGWAGWTAAYLFLPLAFMLLIVTAMLVTPQGQESLEGIRRIPFVYDIVGDAPWISVLGQLLAVKLRTWVMPLVVAAMAALGTALLQRSGPVRSAESPSARGDAPRAGLAQASVRFALLCAIAGLLLTLSVEFVYLADNFRVRMNTVFKFYFQGWVLMAIASAFAIYWLSRRRSGLRSAFVVAFWLLFAMGMVYPVLGNASRAGNFAHTPTLDGMAYLANSHPDDHAAILWLNEQVQGAPVILEAPGSGGSSYVYEGRVSALTGLPTLLGWAGHEGQWRGSYEIQQAREPDIQTIYNSLGVESSQLLLEEYGVTYVYVGPVERQRYDPRGLQKFQSFMSVVYEQGSVTIYKMRDLPPGTRD